MKLFNKKNFSTLISHFSFQKGLALSLSKGFTLIELLIVIAILGVLAAGILVAIDPIDKIKQANDAKVQNDISGIGRASEAYATTHNGFYPRVLQDLVDVEELKRVPVAPPGYSGYTPLTSPGGCAAGSTCNIFVVYGYLRSKKYAATTLWIYDSKTGKSCAIADGNFGPSSQLCP